MRFAGLRLERLATRGAVFIAVLCFSWASSQASTPISGAIDTSQPWTSANSPYVITGTSYIPSGETLVIQPGTRVESDFSSIDVYQGATLTASQVTFANTYIFGDVTILKFSDYGSGGGSGTLTNCTFEPSSAGYHAGLDIGVDAVQVVGGSVPLVYVRDSSPSFTGNVDFGANPEAIHAVGSADLSGVVGNTHHPQAVILRSGLIGQPTSWSLVDGEVLLNRIEAAINVFGATTTLTIAPGLRVESNFASIDVYQGATLTASQVTFANTNIFGDVTIVKFSNYGTGGGSGTLTSCTFEPSSAGYHAGLDVGVDAVQVVGGNVPLVYVRDSSPSFTGNVNFGANPEAIHAVGSADLSGIVGNTHHPQAVILRSGLIGQTVSWSLVDGEVLLNRIEAAVNVFGVATALTIDPGLRVESSLSSIDAYQGATLTASQVTFANTNIFGDVTILKFSNYGIGGGSGALTSCTFEPSSAGYHAGLDIGVDAVQVVGGNVPLVYVRDSSPSFTGNVNFSANPEAIHAVGSADLSGIVGNTHHPQAAILRSGLVGQTTSWSLVDGNVLLNRVEAAVNVFGVATALTIAPGLRVESNLSPVDVYQGATLTASQVTFANTNIFGHVTILKFSDYGTGGGNGTLTNCTFDASSSGYRAELLLTAPTGVTAQFNQFAGGGVIASGPTAEEIDLKQNWWGTTDPVQIEAKILHRNDPPFDRPLVLTVPFLDCGAEVCDGEDNDCDGDVDEDLGATVCGVGECVRLVDNCVGGAPQVCVPGAPVPEVCGNGLDDDCDDLTDVEDPDCATLPVANRYFAVDVPTLLDGQVYPESAIIVHASDGYSLAGSLDSVRGIAALDRRDDGSWIFAPDSALVTPTVTIEPRDVGLFDGSEYSVLFDGSVEGVPSGAKIDALYEAPDGFVFSFDISFVLGLERVGRSDLVLRTGPGMFQILRSANGNVPVQANVIAVAGCGSRLIVTLDVPVKIAGERYLPGDLVRWSLAGFELELSDSSWPRSSRVTGLSISKADFDLDGEPDACDPDDDNDGVPDSSDCAPFDSAVSNVPSEVGPSLNWPEATVLQWNAAADAAYYSVYRGEIGSLNGESYDHTCLAPGVAETEYSDTQLPPAQGAYYLISSNNTCGESQLGSDSSGQPRPNDDHCP